MKRYWAVMVVQHHLLVGGQLFKFNQQSQEVGVIPVFRTKKAALKWKNDYNGDIHKVEIKELQSL